MLVLLAQIKDYRGPNGFWISHHPYLRACACCMNSPRAACWPLFSQPWDKSRSGTLYGHVPVSVSSINHSGELCKKERGGRVACIHATSIFSFWARPQFSLIAGFPVNSAEYLWQMQLHLELVKLPLAICPTRRRRQGAYFETSS